MLARKLEEAEEREGRRPGGRARKRMKDELVHELLPRAFVRPSRTDALLDLKHGLCIVDTSSRKNAEAVVSALRQALGSLPAQPANRCPTACRWARSANSRTATTPALS